MSKRFLFSLSVLREDLTVLEENESINKLEAIIYDFLIYIFKKYFKVVLHMLSIKCPCSAIFSAHDEYQSLPPMSVF